MHLDFARLRKAATNALITNVADNLDPVGLTVANILFATQVQVKSTMASLQEPAPGSKSTKFVAANPLGPMVDPFQNLVRP
jgi:hypothetical protein